MDEVFIAIKFAVLMFALYAVIAAVETGVGFFKLFPHLLKSQAHLEKAFHPLWKVSTLFLVIGAGSIWFFFADVNQILEFQLKPLALWITGLLIARWLLYLLLFLRAGKPHPKVLYGAYLLLCLSVPALLCVGAVYFLNGELGITPLSATLAALSISTILWACTSFMLQHQKEATNKKLISLAHTFVISSLLLTGVVLPWVTMAYAGQLYDNPAFSFIFLLVAIVGGAWWWIVRSKMLSYAWPIVIIFIIGVFAVLSAAHWPYLMFPDIPLHYVYTGTELMPRFINGIILTVIVAGSGFYWIYRLAQKARKKGM